MKTISLLLLISSLTFAQTVDVPVSGRITTGGANDGSTAILFHKKGGLKGIGLDGGPFNFMGVCDGTVKHKIVEGNCVLYFDKPNDRFTESQIKELRATGKYERLVKVNDSTFVLLKKEESFSKRLERLTKMNSLNQRGKK